ncbi:helix-turn-helix transcriptional regulator [Gordonia caeni]|uniref:WYL domain-containing protein n=1 Tax=Gordonia caeni TaxID=1007097 RepID=A0ABP7P1B9_9ACTN
MADTSSRVLTLLSLLQVPRAWPGPMLAERLDVTTRTVRRDVDRLRELGYRIHADKGPEGGYRLEAGTELPPLRFDDEQAIAIAIALRNSSATGVEIDEAAQRALATIRQVLPSRLRHRVDGVHFTSGAAAVSVTPETLETVGTAVRQQMTLRFGYRDPDGPPRRVQPHGLVSRNTRWYLVGWDLDREDWRTYRLDRMTLRTPTGPVFEPRPIPTGNPATFLAARSKGSESVDEWPCIGVVEIDLPAHEVAQWVHDGQVEALTAHTTRLTMGSWSWTGLLASIARFDSEFRIVGPEGLTRAAHQLEQRLHQGRS